MSPKRKSMTNLILVFLLIGILFYLHFRNLRSQLSETEGESKTERIEK